MSFIAAFALLPIEVVHMICLFTGKFVFDKQGRFKSIIYLRDFENINQHIPVFALVSHKSWLINPDKTRFIRYLHSEIYNRPTMSEEERNQAELLHFEKVDYRRHKSLFLQEGTIEEVMIPVADGIFCEPCKRKLSSSELEHIQHRRRIRYSFDDGTIDGFNVWYHYVYISVTKNTHEKCCRNCFNPIYNKLEVKVVKEEQPVIKKVEKTYIKSIAPKGLRARNDLRPKMPKMYRRLR
jgi:hypothetical protein